MSYCPRGDPKRSQVCPIVPKNLKKVQIYPNPVITLMEVNSLTLHSLHYIMVVLCKAARQAQIKEKITKFGAVIRLFVSYLFESTIWCKRWWKILKCYLLSRYIKKNLLHKCKNECKFRAIHTTFVVWKLTNISNEWQELSHKWLLV